MRLKFREIGAHIGLVWGIIGAMLLLSFPPSSLPCMIGFWGCYPLIACVGLAIGGAYGISLELGRLVGQYGWVLLPLFGAGILGLLGYLMDLIARGR